MNAQQACNRLNEALEKDSSLVGMFQLGFHVNVGVAETSMYCEMSTRPESCFISVLGIVNAIIDDSDSFLVTMSNGKFVVMEV